MTYTAIALFPVILVIMNSFKSRAGIFGAPLTPPTPKTFDLIGYTTVIGQGDFNLAAGEPGVGVYIDDVYFATTLGSAFDLLDLDIRVGLCQYLPHAFSDDRVIISQ